MIIGATGDPKILVIWQHGDEPIGPKVGHRIYSEHSDLLEHVDYVCGNPRAASKVPPSRDSQGGSDLNRAYSSSTVSTYEDTRADIIRGLILDNDYDYILDLHTTRTEGGGYFIADERTVGNRAVKKMIGSSLLRNVVVFPERIARDGLIGNYPNAISIEYEKPVANKVGVDETILLIRELVESGVTSSGSLRRKRNFYAVTDKIYKTEDPGLTAKNFQLTEAGYYPILFGENTYRTDPTKDYLGFKATSVTTKVL